MDKVIETEQLSRFLKDINVNVEKIDGLKYSSAEKKYLKIKAFLNYVLVLSCFTLTFLLLFCVIFKQLTGTRFIDVVSKNEYFEKFNGLVEETYSLLIHQNRNTEDSCLLSNRAGFIFGAPANCDICKHVNRIDEVTDITQKEFVEKYAYTNRPVLIRGAAKNWSAAKYFSFKFFQVVYAQVIRNQMSNEYSDLLNLFTADKLDDEEMRVELLNTSNELEVFSCQFFDYKNDAQNLYEFLLKNISQLETGKPWYVGWSNCNPMVTKVLRQHYPRPYFLPDQSESLNSDWIFMGLKGYGAPMHIDFVENNSWQAQLRSEKVWTLKAPLECSLVCGPPINVTVRAGDIIVVNTNYWYHQTLITGDEISVTIGAEYD